MEYDCDFEHGDDLEYDPHDYDDYDDDGYDDPLSWYNGDNEEGDYLPNSGTLASNLGLERSSTQGLLIPSTTATTEGTSSNAIGTNCSDVKNLAEELTDIGLKACKRADLEKTESAHCETSEETSLKLTTNTEIWQRETARLQLIEKPENETASPKGAYSKNEMQEHAPGALQSESDIEANVMKLRDMICQCVQEPTVVSYLSTVLSADESSRLRKIFDRSSEGAEKLVDAIRNSDVKGKWTAFMNALKNAGYPNLVDLLNKQNPGENEQYERKMIQIFSPTLEKHLIVTDVVSELGSSDVITEIDKHEVIAKLESKGNPYAAIVLLDRMQCRMAPRKWYGLFLKILQEKGYDDLVKTIEPDFFQCPSEFLDDRDIWENPSMQVMQKPLNEDVKETVDTHNDICSTGRGPEMSFNETKEKLLWNCFTCKESGDMKEACSYCKNCSKFFCQTCVKDHNRFIKDHVVLGECEMDRMEISLYQKEDTCHEHGQPYTLYCENHDLVCCAVCAQISHGVDCEGKVNVINEVASAIVEQEEYKDFQHNLSSVLALVDHKTMVLRSLKRKYQVSKTNNRELVMNFRNKLVQTVDQLLKNTLLEIDKTYDELEAANQEDIQICTDITDVLNQMKSVASDPSHASKVSAIKAFGSKLQQCLKKLKDLKQNKEVTLHMHQTIFNCLTSHKSLGSVETLEH